MLLSCYVRSSICISSMSSTGECSPSGHGWEDGRKRTVTDLPSSPHSDLKPENILIDYVGHISLCGEFFAFTHSMSEFKLSLSSSSS